MKYLKLIKLLYLADREALSRWGRPITTDNYVSMDKGPVLSQILKRIDDGAAPGEPTFWTSHIIPCGDWDVLLTGDPSDGQLSEAEEELLDFIFKYSHRNRWDIVKFVHTLPEWKDPAGSAIPIDYRRERPLSVTPNASCSSSAIARQISREVAGILDQRWC